MDTLKTIMKWISAFILIMLGFALLKPYGVLFAGLACFMCAWVIIMGVGPTKSFLEFRVDSLERMVQNIIFKKV
jgi:membrane protein YdbS with pleckstrin-like domain